jgi:hypothetical protein
MSGTISFPANPTVGQLYTFNNTTWVWNGTVWTNANTGTNFLPLSGGTINPGPLNLHANASSPMSVPTYQQVSGLIPQNYVDNSGFTWNQRGYASGTALTAGSYGFDRWKAGSSGCTLSFTASQPSTIVTISAGSVQQVVDTPLMTVPYVLSWTGTATGRIATASGGGTYAASPVAFTPSSNTIGYIEFTGGTLGQVQLQLGTVATPWQPLPIQTELMRCLRYYQTALLLFAGYTLQNGQPSTMSALLAPMRTTPTVNIGGASASNLNTGWYVAASAVAYWTTGFVGSSSNMFSSQGNVFFSADL